MPGSARLNVLPGVTLWPGYLDRTAQEDLVVAIIARTQHAPFYRPRMPRSGKSFSVEQTNFGSHGWYSDESGYRYQAFHPVTKRAWPEIPELLTELWCGVGTYAPAPECCLVNLYRDGARMGLHQDRDEEPLDAPVVSLSLGDSALFRIGGTSRRGQTTSVMLHSGDVIVFGGPARLSYHGIDRVIAGSSSLIKGGGRINLTLRRVTVPSKR